MSQSVRVDKGKRRPTYGVVLAQMVPRVAEGLLVHVLHVAVRVAVHFHTVWRGRDTMVRAEHLVLWLREDGRTSLDEVRHAIVEEVGIHAWLGLGVGLQIYLRLLRARCAIHMTLGNLRGEVVVEVVLAECVGHATVLRTAMAEGNIVEVWQVKVAEVVKVYQVAKVLVHRSVHARPRLCICTVHCVRRASAGGGTASVQVGRVSTYEARAISSASLVGLPSLRRW